MPGHGTGGGPVQSVDVVVGLVASPGPATDLANELLPDLSRRITGRLPVRGGTSGSCRTGSSSGRPT
jgi:hypothetical protein